MTSFARDVRYAIKALVTMRGVAVVAILTLALGIGATTTMFSVVYALLLRPAPFESADRLVVIYNTSTTPRDGTTRLRWSMPNIVALRSTATSFESMASFTSALLSTSGHGSPEHVEGEVVSSDYFRTLRVMPSTGRAFRSDEDTPAGAQPVTMISWRFWKRTLAGDPGALGGTIVVNDVPLTVIGILPQGFAGMSGKADLWIPPPMAARLTYAEYLTTPQNFISVVARLKDDVTASQANAELALLGPRFVGNGSAPDTVWGADSIPLRSARVDPVQRHSVLGLLAAAACVLLIACVNVASLLLARARMRRREIAIRLAIGSGRRRLIQLLLTEGLVMALTAGAVGTLLAQWGIEIFARTAPPVIASGRNFYAAIGALGQPRLDPAVLAFALAIAIGTTLLFALAPALSAARLELTTALKDNDRGSSRRGRALSLLVVTEVALACLLLAAAGLLIEDFARIQARRSGFVSDRVLTFWVRPPGSRYPVSSGPTTVERLLTRVQSVPGVEAAAVNRCAPFTGCSRTLLFLPGGSIDPQNAPVIGRHYISPDYFRVLGIPLLAGRSLTTADRAGSPPVAIVNESGARRLWSGENPIGKRVWFGPTTGPFSDSSRAVEVVGVVGDVKYEGADLADRPDRAEFYTSYLQFSYPDTMMIVKSRGAPAGLLAAMRDAVASVDPALPIYDAMTLEDRIDAAVRRPRFNTTLLASFAAAALLLAAMGVYGMLSYSVSSRLRDIGMRLAFGADAPRVMALVLGEGLRLAAIGAVIGTVAAIAGSRLAQKLLPGAPGGDLRLIAAAVAIVLAVSLVAAFVPARRACSVDPIVVLRND
jgi:putative ABC transport system permease protein